MDFSYIALLSLLQGLTEFLPVSSSGHLVLLPKILDVKDQGLLMDVALHVGTLCAILVYYRRDVLAMIRAVLFWRTTEDVTARNLAVYIVLATIPAAMRYRNQTKKYLLKKAMEGTLPHEIIHRSKMGFGVPLKHWFRSDAAEFARDTLLSQRARERGIFSTTEVERTLARHGEGRRDFSAKLWTLLFFEAWCQKWLDQPVVVDRNHVSSRRPSDLPQFLKGILSVLAK